MAKWREISAVQRREIWERIAAGESVNAIAQSIGRHTSAVRAMLRTTGGVCPGAPVRSPRALSVEEREEISRGLASGESMRAIAQRLHRSPSTISREVRRNGGCRDYRAGISDRRATRRARRPKPGKLTRCPHLRAEVEQKLALRWSPEQISRWLARSYPGNPEMNVSHETIYLSLYVQGRGELRRELHHALRSGRALRRPKRRLPNRDGHIPGMVLISERPAEVDDRAVPGHWESQCCCQAAMGAARMGS